MKNIFLLIIVSVLFVLGSYFIQLSVKPKPKKSNLTTFWSQKEIIFVIPQNGQTNNVSVLTGLRSDGVFVWRMNRTGFEYNAK